MSSTRCPCTLQDIVNAQLFSPLDHSMSSCVQTSWHMQTFTHLLHTGHMRWKPSLADAPALQGMIYQYSSWP